MIVDRHLREILSATFGPLAIREDSDPLPGPRSLTMLLEKIAPDETGDEYVDTATASHLPAAAIDIWLRSVHSFLISVSLTECSPIWASICGYYASHYSVRPVAHVLGFFQLFRKKKLVQLKVDDGRCICVFRKKAARSGDTRSAGVSSNIRQRARATIFLLRMIKDRRILMLDIEIT